MFPERRGPFPAQHQKNLAVRCSCNGVQFSVCIHERFPCAGIGLDACYFTCRIYSANLILHLAVDITEFVSQNLYIGVTQPQA